MFRRTFKLCCTSYPPKSRVPDWVLTSSTEGGPRIYSPIGFMLGIPIGAYFGIEPKNPFGYRNWSLMPLTAMMGAMIGGMPFTTIPITGLVFLPLCILRGWDRLN